VVPKLLLAGPYPGHASEEIGRRQLERLLAAGIRCFVDLMEEGPRGAAPYAPLLLELAAARGSSVERLHFPIEDHDVPSDAQMDRLESALELRWQRRVPVYFHCWGGRGRTGIVAALALVRTGQARPERFAEALARARSGLPGDSPETPEQVAFVAETLRRRPAAWYREDESPG
jgi:hypothetical protein